MADIKDFKYAIVRQKILEAVRKDLIGPASECEELNEVPTSSYITGLLYPANTAVTEDENYFDIEFTEKKFDAEGESMEAGIFEEEEPEDRMKGGFQKPSSIGVSFYISDNVQKISAYINWIHHIIRNKHFHLEHDFLIFLFLTRRLVIVVKIHGYHPVSIIQLHFHNINIDIRI